MNLRALKAIILSGPWAIDEAWHQIGEAIIRDDSARVEESAEIKALMARKGESAQGLNLVEKRDGVAVLKIHGPIYHRASLMAELCDAPTAQVIRQEFESILNDPGVKAIVFDVDSPGGVVSGIAELGDAIHQARGRKPIVAYIGDLGASAAYWIASATDEVVAGKTASLGSIGVVAAFRKSREDNTVEFVSSKSPRKRMSPETESGRAGIQEHIDALAEVFIADVARNRGVDAETVESDFGRGGLLVGQSAVDAGLADRVGSLESLIAELVTGEWAMKRKKKTSGASAATETGETAMAESLWNRIKARLSGKEDDAAVADAITAEAESADARAEAAEAEARKLREDLIRTRTSAIEADVDAFITAQIKTGKLIPAESADARADLLQAAMDDLAIPKAESEKSRLTRRKEAIEARQAHSLFTERVADGGLKLATDPAQSSATDTESRRRELLAMTPTGQAALRLKEAGK